MRSNPHSGVQTCLIALFCAWGIVGPTESASGDTSLNPHGTLLVRVVDHHGRAVGHVRVVVYDHDGERVASDETDDHGRCEFELDAGRYDLRVAGHPVEASVRVRHDRVTRMTIEHDHDD